MEMAIQLTSKESSPSWRLGGEWPRCAVDRDEELVAIVMGHGKSIPGWVG